MLAGHLPTVVDLPHLPYTLQVFKETLRLYPPVYAFTRGASVPVQLGNYSIPKGTSVVISPYTLHRRSKFFPDPERFDPERFSPQQEQKLIRYSYTPFGAGAHICLGMHFALLEGQLILASLAQHLTFEFAGTRPVEPELEPFIYLPVGFNRSVAKTPSPMVFPSQLQLFILDVSIAQSRNYPLPPCT